MQKMISIIIPVYNVKEYLTKCVESIVNQSYPKLEIILVDDGSTDGSGEICDLLSWEDERIQVIHKKNGGLSSARNAGIDIAKGDFIGFVDSDDYIAEEMYEVLLTNLQKNAADISICNRWYEREDGTKFLRYKPTADVMIMDSKKAILEMNSFRTFDMSVCDKLYQRELFEGIRFPEGKLSEDFYIMYRLFDKAEKICYISAPLYYYMQRTGSISHNKKINFDFVKAAKEQMEYIEKKYPELAGCVHSSYASANMTVYNFHKKNKVKCPKEVKIELQKNVKGNLAYVLKNRELSLVKKIQALLFVYCALLYDYTFFLYKKIDKI